MNDRPRVAILTGGVASGKSAVSDRLAEAGIEVIDTDRIAREVVAPGTRGLEEIAAAFGESMIAADGTLDRERLRREVFSDPRSLRRLEAITHPRIIEQAQREIDARRGQDRAVLVVPLLVESGQFAGTDAVIVVDVPERTQIERLMARDGIDHDTARAMLRAQAGREQRLAIADYVVDNSGPKEALDGEVAKLLAWLRRRD